jgi:hypothetical protein
MATPNIATMIAGDYANIDSDIKVSVTVLQPNGTTTWTCSNAIRFNRDYDWIPVGEGDFPGGLVTFGLWVSECTERPKLSAKITNGTTTYRVMKVEDVGVNTRYDVACTQEL